MQSRFNFPFLPIYKYSNYIFVAEVESPCFEKYIYVALKLPFQMNQTAKNFSIPFVHRARLKTSPRSGLDPSEWNWKDVWWNCKMYFKFEIERYGVTKRGTLHFFSYSHKATVLRKAAISAAAISSLITHSIKVAS